MVKKIFILAAFMIFVSVMAFSADIIPGNPGDLVTYIQGYIKFMNIETVTNYHYLYFDETMPIIVSTNASYNTTLTQKTKEQGILILDMTNPGSKDVLAMLMLAKTSEWRITVQIRVGIEINGYNTINYVMAPK